MKALMIAAIAHVALAELAVYTGDADTVVAFDDLSEGERQAMISGIELIMDPDSSCDTRHNAWASGMTADGWTHGQKKDVEQKTHPLLKDFGALPKKVITRERMLFSLVKALQASDCIHVSELQDQVGAPAASAPLVDGVPIEYIGLKDSHTDTKYGTKLIWIRGQVHYVPKSAAARMLVHTDVYRAAGDVVPNSAESVPVVSKDGGKKQEIPLPHLEGMNKNELISFAQQHYGEALETTMTEPDMRSRIFAVIQSRGR